MSNDVMLITGELCYALLGNINAHLASVSFDLLGKDRVRIQFVFSELSELEKELVEDTLCEFEALHGRLDTLEWDVVLEADCERLLTHVVFKQYRPG